MFHRNNVSKWLLYKYIHLLYNKHRMCPPPPPWIVFLAFFLNNKQTQTFGGGADPTVFLSFPSFRVNFVLMFAAEPAAPIRSCFRSTGNLNGFWTVEERSVLGTRKVGLTVGGFWGSVFLLLMAHFHVGLAIGCRVGGARGWLVGSRALQGRSRFWLAAALNGSYRRTPLN